MFQCVLWDGWGRGALRHSKIRCGIFNDYFFRPFKKARFWNWGTETIWHNLATAQFFSFFLKNHSTLLYTVRLFSNVAVSVYIWIIS